VDIIGTILIALMLNFAAYFYLKNYSTNYGYWVLGQKWSLLEEMNEPAEWLILGDSSCNQGVIPSLFEQNFGGNAVNLCTIGNMTLVNDLWMLERYIQRFGPPENVVIVHVHDMWSRDFSAYLLGHIPLRWRFWEDFLLNQEIVPSSEIAQEIFKERYYPLNSQSQTLSDILKESFWLERNPFKRPFVLDADGYFSAEEAKPEIVEAGKDQHLAMISEQPFFISYINGRALQEIMKLAEEYQFDVYLVTSPLYEGLLADESFRAYLDSMLAILGESAAQSDKLHLITEIKGFPAELMQNPDHLIRPGAEIYTAWLIERIKEIIQ